MANNESIKDTLEVIRRALEDESDFSKKNDNVLILNKKINDDGTLKMLGQPNDIKEVNPLMKSFAAIKYLIFGTSLDEKK